MTSANVTSYRIEKDGVIVCEFSQHHYCKPVDVESLTKDFTPSDEYTITPYGYDEEEEYWEGQTRSLQSYLSKRKKPS